LSAFSRSIRRSDPASKPIPKSARITQLCDQAGGRSRADAADRGKEFANFVPLKLALDLLVELLYSISQELHVRTGVFDLQTG
jgi:hypothetical protein